MKDQFHLLEVFDISWFQASAYKLINIHMCYSSCSAVYTKVTGVGYTVSPVNKHWTR